jgi:hypothetical protein
MIQTVISVAVTGEIKKQNVLATTQQLRAIGCYRTRDTCRSDRIV